MPRFHGALSQDNAAVASEILPAGRSEVILLVEDDAQVRQLSEAMLRELGYDVLSAPNGVDALSLLRTRQDVHLMFTDVVLPGMNGWQLAEEARRRQSNLKVIYTTGYKQGAIAGAGFLDPNATLLSKPITLERMAVALRDALDH
jgi:CheY-like chemotaxis protein